MIEYEIEQEEMDGSNRVVVVEIEGEEWNAENTLRIQVPVEASKEKIRTIVEATIEDYRLGKEIEGRIDEFKEKNKDPVGLSGKIDFNPKKLVDDRLENDIPLKKSNGKINKEREHPGQGKAKGNQS